MALSTPDFNQNYVPIYSDGIYVYGNRRFTPRDGLKGIPTEYYVPVQQYAASNYLIENINYALEQGWINQQEYDETVAYIV